MTVPTCVLPRCLPAPAAVPAFLHRRGLPDRTTWIDIEIRMIQAFISILDISPLPVIS